MLLDQGQDTGGVGAAVLAAAPSFLERLPPHFEPSLVILYGSRARGDHRVDSDVDLAIVLKNPRSDRYAIVRDFADVAYDVMSDTGLHVHSFPLSESEWSEPHLFSNPALLLAIQREGKRL